MKGESIEQPVARDAHGTGLASLRLSDEHRSALALQGFVAAEFRDGRGPYYKLRFRFQRQQVVKYLGTDPEAAEQICRELQELQRERRLYQELQRLANQARQMIREAKHELQDQIRGVGFRFHGLAVRKITRDESAIGSQALVYERSVSCHGGQENE